MTRQQQLPTIGGWNVTSVLLCILLLIPIEITTSWIPTIIKYPSLQQQQSTIHRRSSINYPQQGYFPRVERWTSSSSDVVTSTTDDDKEEESEEVTTKAVYSLPSLYDLAFGYRDYEEEVQFLLSKHYEHNSIVDKTTTRIRILELAAGPARHSITALSNDEHVINDDITLTVDSVVCIDNAKEMQRYALEIADEELEPSKKLSLEYRVIDMRNFTLAEDDSSSTNLLFDTSWILLGSLQHLTTNIDILNCFQSIHTVLKPGGTCIIELPHPREIFQIGECTKNGWEVPFDDDEGNEVGTLQITWGDDGDIFDPIQQIRYMTIAMEVVGANSDEIQNVKQVVPQRLITSQEIDILARLSNFEVISHYGALEDGIDITNEDLAYRLVCVLRKLPTV